MVCGAKTVRGSQCKRVVRSGGRCYQHLGKKSPPKKNTASTKKKASSTKKRAASSNSDSTEWRAVDIKEYRKLMKKHTTVAERRKLNVYPSASALVTLVTRAYPYGFVDWLPQPKSLCIHDDEEDEDYGKTTKSFWAGLSGHKVYAEDNFIQRKRFVDLWYRKLTGDYEMDGVVIGGYSDYGAVVKLMQKNHKYMTKNGC